MVLLHYSIRINAAAMTAAYSPLSTAAEAVYIFQSVAAAAYTPRSGPTGSGKSMFVRRFVHNIKHMMTPKPDRILLCYGEYQTLYVTVEGIELCKH
jgi:hypothetical protein